MRPSLKGFLSTSRCQTSCSRSASRCSAKRRSTFTDVPTEVKATLRTYQIEGVHWLERLRMMYLNGILADDMGLGKTLQAIVAITQIHEEESAHVSDRLPHLASL